MSTLSRMNFLAGNTAAAAPSAQSTDANGATVAPPVALPAAPPPAPPITHTERTVHTITETVGKKAPVLDGTWGRRALIGGLVLGGAAAGIGGMALAKKLRNSDDN